MAKGQKYNDDIKEQAFALLAANNNCQFVADKLGLPYTTVKTWEKRLLAQSQKNAEGAITNPNEQNLVNARNKKKLEFIEQSWATIKLASELLNKRLARALFKEAMLDKMLEEAEKDTISKEQRKAMANNIAAMKLEDAAKISTILGTLYDKSALANGEATSREEQIVKKFEDF